MTEAYVYNEKSITIQVTPDGHDTWNFIITIKGQGGMVGYLFTKEYPTKAAAMSHAKAAAQKRIDKSK